MATALLFISILHRHYISENSPQGFNLRNPYSRAHLHLLPQTWGNRIYTLTGQFAGFSPRRSYNLGLC